MTVMAPSDGLLHAAVQMHGPPIDLLSQASQGSTQRSAPSRHILAERSSNSGKKHEASYIMETNDSSIVSKRAVEYMYYQKPHFFRYFVKKRKPRAPLISRGYWLRMKCIENVLLDFLDANASKQKVVVNLGAGFDPLAFSTLSKFPDRCQDAVFVDVDYPDLIEKKCDAIRVTEELESLVKEGNATPGENASIKWQSKQYIALGCDLNDPIELQDFLSREFDRSKTVFLVISEVAVCYMNVDRADSLIKWIAGIGNVQFCLLEQFLPHGDDHPFAKTMLNHFAKIKSPLKAIRFYPQLHHQRKRFLEANWRSVNVKSLWELWSDIIFLPADQKHALNAEPFDEWEDLALFASHYFLLVATNEASQTASLQSQSVLDRISPPSKPRNSQPTPNDQASNALTPDFNRRFSALYETQSGVYDLHGGYGDQTRVGTTLTFNSDNERNTEVQSPLPEIEPRMCHTITTLNDCFDCLLAGGRSSPVRALSDCWLRQNGVWKMVQPLPFALYRHCAVRVLPNGDDPGVLVFGGRSADGVVSSSWFLWRLKTGWTEIKVHATTANPRFGAAMATSPDGYQGLLVGGIDENGVVISECYRWALHKGKNDPLEPGALCIDVVPLHQLGQLPVTFYRFGACLVSTSMGFILVGGITASGILRKEEEVLYLGHCASLSADSIKPLLNPADIPSLTSFLPTGHSVIWDGNGITILGGGATCFSFGTYVNPFLWRVDLHGKVKVGPWRMAEKLTRKPLEKRPAVTSEDGASTKSIPSIVIASEPEFLNIVLSSQPIVLRDLHLGACTRDWTPAYLLNKVGPDRMVSIHRSNEDHMSFQPGQKSFVYKDLPFSEFISSIEKGGKEYFRALSGMGHNSPANFHDDFAELAADFEVPSQLALATTNFHSSVLRISGPVSMWLHYDVMANVLFQISGSKRLLLYPPADVSHLDIPAGSSSSRLHIFEADTLASLRGVHPHEVILRPGEALFIPPLWFHAAAPTDGISIAVNVFFHNLETGYAPGRDVYGNRDLQAYEDGRKDIAKVIKRFNGLPKTMSDFYLRRLGQEIEDEIARLSGRA